MKISKNTAYLLTGLAALMWATSGTLTVLAIDEGANVMEIAVFTAVFSLLILGPAIAVLDRPSLRIHGKDLPTFAIFGLVTGTLFSIAWFTTVDLTSVTTALVLLYAYPSIVTVASIFLLREKMTTAKALALPLTFIGCVLVSHAYNLDEMRVNAVGIGLGVFTAFGAALYYLMAKGLDKRYTANTVVLYYILMETPGLILIAGPLAVIQTTLSTEAWFLIFLMGLLPGTIGFLASIVALKHLEASKASIVASIEPVFGVIIAVIVIAERVDWLQTIGVALVVSGVLILRVAHKEDKDVADVPPSIR